jgi:hypothetical protein
VPGKVYDYSIVMSSISYIFLRGDKIQVQILSSNFPWNDRNPNTGDKFGEDTDLQTATQTIYHDSQYSSYIILPLLSSP